ncbi:4-hydroxy-tetrahydrodipicolinate reductase [Erysipelothrix urinaevulpis]|uniref:4-hydroxy-tetrahydrodipicolinate reductase n=1 Tax=Erysipelothrix urinaevulpis TaxID=2683717 RepID=UPI00135CB70D|nr:4-hydroxy-tetrahydrodipicolinate reductase [Erysipelothrix urinaevulpis]
MRLLLCGYDGAMGKTFSSLYDVTAGYAPSKSPSTYPVFDDLNEVNVDVDVIIDFSHFSLTKGIIDYAVRTKTPLVIATTGLSDIHHNYINEAAEVIPILQTGNFSRGMNILASITETLTQSLPNYDIEITETHHQYKKDAPSGSAEMLFNAVKRVRNDAVAIYDRTLDDEIRFVNEVGIHSLRGGHVVGDHQVFFFGENEQIEIKHHANSKAVFAQGAYEAAEFIFKAPCGRYDFKDVIFK